MIFLAEMDNIQLLNYILGNYTKTNWNFNYLVLFVLKIDSSGIIIDLRILASDVGIADSILPWISRIEIMALPFWASILQEKKLIVHAVLVHTCFAVVSHVPQWRKNLMNFWICLCADFVFNELGITKKKAEWQHIFVICIASICFLFLVENVDLRRASIKADHWSTTSQVHKHELIHFMNNTNLKRTKTHAHMHTLWQTEEFYVNFSCHLAHLCIWFHPCMIQFISLYFSLSHMGSILSFSLCANEKMQQQQQQQQCNRNETKDKIQNRC